MATMWNLTAVLFRQCTLRSAGVLRVFINVLCMINHTQGAYRIDFCYCLIITRTYRRIPYCAQCERSASFWEAIFFCCGGGRKNKLNNGILFDYCFLSWWVSQSLNKIPKKVPFLQKGMVRTNRILILMNITVLWLKLADKSVIH